MNKKIKAIIAVIVIGVIAIMVLPNIIQKEYSTAGETKGQIETGKESINKDEKVDEPKENDVKQDMPEETVEKYTLDNLNMRRGPSTDFDIIQTIPVGEKVIVIGHKDGWDEITYKEETGFSSINYLTESKKDADLAKVNRQEKTSKVDREEKPQKAVETMKVIQGILLVNKTYGLPSDYNPGENPEAVAHLNKMSKAAMEEIGKKIMSVSGFRSYDYQKGLFQRNVKRSGEKSASMYSARAGHSEHQTGLAFDLAGNDKSQWLKQSFADTAEGKWLKKNAHKFGFILRYPKGKTDITGYIYEPWHFRYIGIEHATKVYESGLTLEEYLL